MATYIGKKAGKKLFEQHLEHYTPQDPLYEFYTDERGRQRRRQRQLPPGLSKRDAQILKSVQRRAHYLDKGLNICGFRCGWTLFIGLIPVVGDIADISLNYFLVVRKSKQADIPPWLLRQMLAHNVVSAGVGFIPIVGGLVVGVYKANSRNAALFEEFLRIRGEEYLKLNTGPDGRPLNAAEKAEKQSKGWAWLRKRGISQKDAEQVKPGAGMVEGEAVPANTIDTDSVGERPGTSSSKAISAGGATTTAKGAPPSQGKARKRFSLPLGGNGNGNRTSNLSETPTEGRFVEHIDPDNRKVTL